MTPMNDERENKWLYNELESRYHEIPELKKLSAYSPAFKAWRSEVEALLSALYGTRGDPAERFRAILSTPLFLSCRMDDGAFQDAFLEGLEDSRILIAEILERRNLLST